MTTFEYASKRGLETPFETFLRYTDEKEKSAKELSKVLKKILRQSESFLDIGTGNGEYLKMALSKLKPLSLNLTLLEPSKDLVKSLKNTRFQDNTQVRIVNQTFEDFKSDDKYSTILASHLYHIKKSEREKQFTKMLNLLQKEGTLIYVIRKKDDVYDFKMKFKPRIYNYKSFEAQSLEQSLITFRKISGSIPITIKILESHSHVKLPIQTNHQDTITIVEFFLNKKWDGISKKIQKEILSYLKERKGDLKQIDGMAIIKKS